MARAEGVEKSETLRKAFFVVRFLSYTATLTSTAIPSIIGTSVAAEVQAYCEPPHVSPTSVAVMPAMKAIDPTQSTALSFAPIEDSGRWYLSTRGMARRPMAQKGRLR